jgi:hypothetical protein
LEMSRRVKEQAVEAARAAELRAQNAEIRLEPLLQEVDCLRRSVEDERRGHYDAHKQLRALIEQRGANSTTFITSTVDHKDTDASTATAALTISSNSFSALTPSFSAPMPIPSLLPRVSPSNTDLAKTFANSDTTEMASEMAKLRVLNGTLASTNSTLEQKLSDAKAEIANAQASYSLLLTARSERITALEKAKEAAEEEQADAHEAHAGLLEAQHVMEARLSTIQAREGNARAAAELTSERMEAHREMELMSQRVAQLERDCKLAEEGREGAEGQLASAKAEARDSLGASRRLEAEASAAKADIVMLEEVAAAAASSGDCADGAGTVMMERARLAERRWEQAEARCRQAESMMDSMRREGSPENAREGSPTTMGTPRIQSLGSPPLQPMTSVSFTASPMVTSMGLGMEVERLRERLAQLEEETSQLRQGYQEAVDEETKQRRRAEGALTLRDEAARREEAMRIETAVALGETRRDVMRLAEIWCVYHGHLVLSFHLYRFHLVGLRGLLRSAH